MDHSPEPDQKPTGLYHPGRSGGLAVGEGIQRLYYHHGGGDH